MVSGARESEGGCMVNAASDLLELKPYSNHVYERYALTSLTACSVFLLQEWLVDQL